MAMTASQLRANIYRVLDQILETGAPVEIERGGRRLRIIAIDAPSRLSRLVRRADAVNGDPEDLVHIDWSSEWRP
jgi:Antitoxin Phd_YefM, type II toxin-antitoxin system